MAGVGGGCTISHEFSSNSDLPTDLLYHIYAIPYYDVLVMYCQQFPFLRFILPQHFTFWCGSWQNAAELCEVKSSNVDLCLQRC